MSTFKDFITVSPDHVITTMDTRLEPTEGLGSIMFANMRKNKDKIAQINTKTDERQTFGEVLQRCVRVALHLSEKKVTRDDVITICSKNHLDVIVPYVATQFLGAKIGSVDPSFSPQELNHLLNVVRPKMIFTQEDSVPLLEQILKDILHDAEIVIFEKNFKDFLKPHPKEDTFEPVKIDNLKDIALIYFSSGTTGLPKGICLSHYTFGGRMINTRFGKEADKDYLRNSSSLICQLLYTTVYWISCGSMIFHSIMDGFCRLVCESFDGKEFWNVIEKYKPMNVMLTPVQVIEMFANKRDVNVDGILSFMVIGSSISKEYLFRIQETFPKAIISCGYGQTEVSGPLAMFQLQDPNQRAMRSRPEKIESVGIPVPGISYRVVDLETNKNVGPNQRGELRVKTKFLMNGYYKMDSSDTFDEDGWLKTGDVVYYDEDFCFYVLDRIKEAFKYQGWFIAPTILENELMKHPAVKIAVVIGIPKDDGHHPMGLVVLKEGFEVTEEEIEKFVEERVSERLRLRAGVKFIKSVPLTVTGKIIRRELKKMVLEGKL